MADGRRAVLVIEGEAYGGHVDCRMRNEIDLVLSVKPGTWDMTDEWTGIAGRRLRVTVEVQDG